MGALIVIYTTIIGTFQMLGRSLLHVRHKQLDFFIQVATLLKHQSLEVYAAALGACARLGEPTAHLRVATP